MKLTINLNITLTVKLNKSYDLYKNVHKTPEIMSHEKF